MIVFDLECRDLHHRFEGWFASSGEFARQREAGLLACPQCGSVTIDKAVMAPAVSRKGNQLPVPARPARATAMPQRAASPTASTPPPPEALAMMRKLAAMQADALKSSRFVGDSFAEDARAMHYGERDVEIIHGQATLREAKELLEEGITVAPLPFPVIEPGEAN